MATPAIAVESVRMYVMRPTWPSGVSAPSYRRWAMDIVRLGLKPSFRLASCWRVEVVNGGAGDRFWVRVPVFVTTGCALAERGGVPVGGLRVADVERLAIDPDELRCEPCRRSRWRGSASSVQYSRAVKASISRSRSTTRRTATDWTRPAESPPRTFRDSSGLSV